MKIIELGCEPHHTLDWEREIQLARETAAVGKKIFWKLGLGLEQPFFPLEDEFRFQSLTLPLAQFSKDVWPVFQEASFGLCLYRGSADLPVVFSWTERQKESYAAWILDEELPDDEHSRRLFCLEAFAIYFQMLSHRLPDEAAIFLLFDLTGFRTASQIFAALSKERFGHFMLGTKGRDLPREGFRWEENKVHFFPIDSSTGIVFPENHLAHKEFDDHLVRMEKPVKVVFESFLSEEWEGLDRLYVLSKNLSPQGERMLKGFSAAGGEVNLI
jgi:hypothetical protein